MFKDHFSGHADMYAKARPTYPAELFSYLASLCHAHDLAWDCATGNGQAAQQLAKRFEKVIATDASEKQLAQAKKITNIEYRKAPAEQSGIESETVDLITVAQALHWFDFENFFKEVHRVLKPKGVLAVWIYGLLESECPKLNQLVHTFYYEIVGAYWPKERKHLDNYYQDIPFPYEKLTTPKFAIQPNWNLQELLSYFSTWSSVKYYKSENKGENPVETWLKPRIKELYGNLNQSVNISLPIYMLVGIK